MNVECCVVDQLLQGLPRLERLDVKVIETLDAAPGLQWRIAKPASDALESLIIRRTSYLPSVVVSIEQLGGIPALRSLSLDCTVSAPEISSHLTGLTSLELSGYRIDIAPPDEEFCQLLAALPQLQRLGLNELVCEDMDLYTEPLRLFSESVTSLRLDNYDSYDTYAWQSSPAPKVLGTLFPNLQTLEVSCSVDNNLALLLEHEIKWLSSCTSLKLLDAVTPGASMQQLITRVAAIKSLRQLEINDVIWARVPWHMALLLGCTSLQSARLVILHNGPNNTCRGPPRDISMQIEAAALAATNSSIVEFKVESSITCFPPDIVPFLLQRLPNAALIELPIEVPVKLQPPHIGGTGGARLAVVRWLQEYLLTRAALRRSSRLVATGSRQEQQAPLVFCPYPLRHMLCANSADTWCAQIRIRRRV
jgi:hypothetical protein